MKINNLIQMTIASVVVILVTLTVAVPIISELAIVTTDGTNTGATFYMEIAEDPDFTIKVENSKVYVGDFETTSLSASGAVMLLYTDSFAVYSAGTRIFVMDNNEWKETTSIAVAEGSITFTPQNSTSTEKTYTGDLYYASSATAGTYGVVKLSDSTSWRFNDEDHIFIGFMTMTATNSELSPTRVSPASTIKGTASDNDFTIVDSNIAGTGTYSLADAVTYDEELKTYVLTKGSASGTWTNTTGTYTAATATTQLVAPVAYQYESESDSVIVTLIEIIPLLLIIGVIMAIVGAALYIRT